MQDYRIARLRNSIREFMSRGERKAYSLIDKVYRFDVLDHALHVEAQRPSWVDPARDRWPDMDIPTSSTLFDLQDEIRSGGYCPRAPRIRQARVGEKTRTICHFSNKDRVVQRAVYTVLEPAISGMAMDCQYGWREGRGMSQFVKRLRLILSSCGYSELVTIDVANFFGMINPSVVLREVEEFITDSAFLRLLSRILTSHADSFEDERGKVKPLGLPLGSCLCPALGEAFLGRALAEARESIPELFKPARMLWYCDDCVVCGDSICDLSEDLAHLSSVLDHYGLDFSVDSLESTHLPCPNLVVLGQSI